MLIREAGRMGGAAAAAIRGCAWGFLVACAGLHSRHASASILLLPPSVAPEALSEAVPTAFTPFEFTTEDFTLEWERSAAEPHSVATGGIGGGEGIRAELETGSLEWVRVSEVLVIPRARVVIRAQAPVSGGTVKYGGFIQPFVVEPDGTAEVRIPVALVSGEEHPIEIAVNRKGKSYSARVFVRYRSRPEFSEPVVLLDPSCSRFGVALEWQGAVKKVNQWAYIGCRLVYTEAENYRTASLEMIVFWDNAGQSLKLAGVPSLAASSSIWQLRLRSEPGYIDLGIPADSGGGENNVRLKYRIPRRLHRGAIGLGVGPYAFSFDGAGSEKVSTWTIMPTLYASYFITETMRIVAFDATTLNSQFISDFGLYFSTEYLRNLDRRVVVNVMLGFHSIGFKSQGKYNFLLGAPQGFEIIITDVFGRAKNLTVGGFIYPSIQGKAYYNTWIRWGTSALFGEVNYISWQERIDERPYSSSSLGLTIGMPIPMLGFL